MQYFKHMSNMRHNLKIKRLISKYGLEGYGLYNLILESITERLCTESPHPEMLENCQDIAEFFNGDTTKINEMAAFMINQGLIEVDDISERITCKKIYKYLESSQTRSPYIREMIQQYKNSTKFLLSETVTDFCEEKKRKEKKRKDYSTKTIKDTLSKSKTFKHLLKDKQ